MTAADPLEEQPPEHGGRRGEVGVDESLGGDAVGGEGGSGVEPEPAEPQDPRAYQREWQRVRKHRLPGPAPAAPENDHGDEGGGTGVDVHDRAPREVERATLSEPAAAEDPLGNGRVDQHDPEAHEPGPGAEAHAIRDGTGDQRRCDDGERHLERHEGEHRQTGVVEVCQVPQADEVEVADDPSAASAERQ